MCTCTLADTIDSPSAIDTSVCRFAVDADFLIAAACARMKKLTAINGEKCGQAIARWDNRGYRFRGAL
jgi:hypothetical protein